MGLGRRSVVVGLGRFKSDLEAALTTRLIGDPTCSNCDETQKTLCEKASTSRVLFIVGVFGIEGHRQCRSQETVINNGLEDILGDPDEEVSGRGWIDSCRKVQ